MATRFEYDPVELVEIFALPLYDTLRRHRLQQWEKHLEETSAAQAIDWLRTSHTVGLDSRVLVGMAITRIFDTYANPTVSQAKKIANEISNTVGGYKAVVEYIEEYFIYTQGPHSKK